MKHSIAAQRQTLPRLRGAGNDQQRLPIAEPTVERHRGIQQRRPDTAPASVWRDHAGQLQRGAKAIEAEEAQQPAVLPPQQVLDAAAATATKPSPLQLQPATVDLDHLPLELSDRIQGP